MTPLEEAQDLLSRPDELVSPGEYRRIMRQLLKMTLLEIKTMKRENERLKSALAVFSRWVGAELDSGPYEERKKSIPDILKWQRKD